MAKGEGEEGGRRDTLTWHLMVGPVMYSGSWLMLAMILLQLEIDLAECWWCGKSAVKQSTIKLLYYFCAKKTQVG